MRHHDTAESHVDVCGPCYHPRPCECLWSMSPPDVTLMPKSHIADQVPCWSECPETMLMSVACPYYHLSPCRFLQSMLEPEAMLMPVSPVAAESQAQMANEATWAHVDVHSPYCHQWSGSMVLTWPGVVSLSMAHVTMKSQAYIHRLCISLKPCSCQWIP